MNTIGATNAGRNPLDSMPGRILTTIQKIAPLTAKSVSACIDRELGSAANRSELQTVKLIAERAVTARIGPNMLVIRKFGIISAVSAIAIV